MKSESDNGSTAPSRKIVQPMRFKPKIPPRKLTKPAVAKTEPSETKDDIVNKELLSKLNDAKSQEVFGRRAPKMDRKVAPAQVAFGSGSTATLARTFGIPKGAVSGNGSDASAPKLEKEYVEPWDYVRSYYPVTLPLRRPYSGDPEILNVEEFGEASATSTLEETQIIPAGELGLMEFTEEPQMIFFQFPAALPLGEKTDEAVDRKANSGKGDKVENEPKKGCNLKDLPAGFMGKMLVYKSGKIKMKLGDALFDVTPGVSCVFAQDVTAINAKEKHCCILGELEKRAVLTPDMDSLLDSVRWHESLRAGFSGVLS